MPYVDTSYPAGGSNNFVATVETKNQAVVYIVRRGLAPADLDNHDYKIPSGEEVPMIYAWGTGDFQYHGSNRGDFSLRIDGDSVIITGIDEFDYHQLHG